MAESDPAVEEATTLAEKARDAGIVLRLIGACAFRIHCPQSKGLYETIDRPITDIDFISYQQHNGKVKQYFDSIGYLSDSRVMALFGHNRHQYGNPKSGLKVDVFFDRLDMNHIIDFKNRLELDFPTISLADLLLEKMQIVQINEKDVKDMIILLREHPVGDSDKETINANYVASLLAEDWGFWYTVMTNLQKVQDYVNEMTSLSPEDKSAVTSRLTELKNRLDTQPKSMKWKMRARIGPKKKWYTDVETIER